LEKLRVRWLLFFLKIIGDMRNPHDKIWGFWPPDDLAPLIWDKMTKLVKTYGLRLNIIYDDPNLISRKNTQESIFGTA
jgi:hypothetical protein